MKSLFAVLLLFALAVCLFAADDPGAQYVDAFLLIQEGDAAKAASDWKAAYTKFSAAQNILLGIRDKSPSWNPHLVQFRLDYCAEQIDQIKPHLASTAAGLSATFVAPPKRGAESAEVRQLRAELAEALKQIDSLKRELQAAKNAAPPEMAELDRLRTQLAEARAEIERAKAAQLSAQAALTKKEAEEAARMAELNQKIAELQKDIADRNRKLEELEKARAEVASATARAEKLARQNKQLTAQLNEAKAAAERAKQTAAELEEARKTNARLQSELAEAKRLASTGAGDVQKLRAELLEARASAERERQQQAAVLEQLRKENQTLAVELAEARRAHTVATATQAELATLRNELVTARAETERIRAESASQIEALRRQAQAPTPHPASDESRDRRTASFTKGVIYAKPTADVVPDEALQRQNRQLSEQLSATTRELEKLRAKLNADARAHNVQRRKLSEELSALQQQNRELARELANLKGAEGNRGVLYRAPTYVPRSERAERLQRENERLAAQLADARRQMTLLRQQLEAKTRPATVAVSSDMTKQELEYQLRRLREENTLLRQLLNRYAAHHPELKREAQGHSISVSPRKP